MMIEFVLHRLKIERDYTALSIHEGDGSAPEQVIWEAVNENLEKTLRTNQTWRIGNVEDIDGNLFFYFGKLKGYAHDTFNEENNEFFHKSDTEAPHTFVAIDIKYQICAIAKNSALASQVSIISRNLAKLLDLSKAAKGWLHFNIDQIIDPVGFLEFVENIEHITKFEMTFGQPNPFDVDSQFHKPMEKLCEAMEARKGKIAVEGENLNKDVIKQVVQSTSSTGHKATIKYTSPDKLKAEIRHTDGDPVTVSVQENEIGDVEGRRKIFSLLRKAYNRARGMEDEG